MICVIIHRDVTELDMLVDRKMVTLGLGQLVRTKLGNLWADTPRDQHFKVKMEKTDEGKGGRNSI